LNLIKYLPEKADATVHVKNVLEITGKHGTRTLYVTKKAYLK